jgi:bifunctional non-homologous end joining protein LigD
VSKKAPAKKAPAKKAPAKKAPAKKAPAKKASAKKASAKRATTKKAATKKAGTRTPKPRSRASRPAGKVARAAEGRGPLATYRAKRDANRTPEPVPARSARPRSGAGDSFVIQEHHARALHWDFRLERDGVLVSWALPKGLPPDPKKNHLAVQTEDHPLEYGSFEGEIPKGEYGGGKVTIWDRGTYETEKWSEREVMVMLHGTEGRAEGRHVLFRTRGNQWMIHRMDPPPPSWEPLPQDLRPMLTQAGSLPAHDEGWAYEFKWDGVRALVFVDGGRIRIVTRNGNDVTATYPELRALGEALGSHQAVLDGELVALDEQGRPSFGVLQERIHVAAESRARRLAQSVPVSYFLFDLLYLDGRSLTALPYDERRRALEGLALAGPAWQTPDAYPGVPGADLLAVARERGLEGVVAKRRDSAYLPGRRTEAWIKIKNFATQEVVVGGFTAGEGRRRGTLGALLVGLPEPAGLRYVGKVGTGFDERTLADLSGRLGGLAAPTSPFSTAVPAAEVRAATWVRPELVGEVRFVQWTREGRLRAPSWRGLRPDKDPADVRLES